MKVKNLMIGNIIRIESQRIPMEDYYPSRFDEFVNSPVDLGESLFYRSKDNAYDIINFKKYKLARKQKQYSDDSINKKAVIFQRDFSDFSSRKRMSRKAAVLLYRSQINK